MPSDHPIQQVSPVRCNAAPLAPRHGVPASAARAITGGCPAVGTPAAWTMFGRGSFAARRGGSPAASAAQRVRDGRCAGARWAMCRWGTWTRCACESWWLAPSLSLSSAQRRCVVSAPCAIRREGSRAARACTSAPGLELQIAHKVMTTPHSPSRLLAPAAQHPRRDPLTGGRAAETVLQHTGPPVRFHTH